MAKSANKHNRLYLTGEPISDELVLEIEEGKINANEDIKKIAR
jgi:elongation factor 2